MIATTVSDTLTALGILLLLVTVFTTFLSAALKSQNNSGNTLSYKQCLLTLTFALCLVIVSILSLVLIFPTFHEVWAVHGKTDWQNSFYLFLLIYILLIPLLFWQIQIGVGAIKNMRFISNSTG